MRRWIVSACAALLWVASAHAQSLNPYARIGSPANDQSLSGTAIIQGTATHPNFLRYELSYAREPELAEWVSLGGSTIAVESGVLGAWNTRAVTDGTYALRVQVFASDGSVNEAVVRNLSVSNAPTGSTAPATSPAATGGQTLAEIQTARDVLQIVGDTLNRAPGAFLNGARWGLIALALVGAYAGLKKLVLWAWRRYRNERMDYGR